MTNPHFIETMDFKFQCPHCEQHLEASTELAGMNVTCPSCETEFVVPSPSPTAAANEKVKYWIVDVRVLVQRAPPVYLKVLIEVPKEWVLSPDGLLPALALGAVTKAVSTRHSHCPVTPIKVGPADGEALKRISGQSDYGDESCRVWVVGRTTAG